MTTRLKARARSATDRLYRRLVHEVAAAGLSAHPGADDVLVTDGDLSGLPDTARRYLRFMGVVGRQRDWSFRARFVGKFLLRPRLGWMPAEALPSAASNHPQASARHAGIGCSAITMVSMPITFSRSRAFRVLRRHFLWTTGTNPGHVAHIARG